MSLVLNIVRFEVPLNAKSELVVPEFDTFASSHHHSVPGHIRIVFAMEAREDPSIEDRAGRLVATTGHLFLDWKIAGTSSYTQRAFRRLRKNMACYYIRSKLWISREIMVW